MTKRIVKVHVAPIQQQCLQQREKQIDAPDANDGMQNAGVQFVISDAVHLGDEELHSAHAHIRQDGDSEHDDGQTTNPLCHATLGKFFYVASYFVLPHTLLCLNKQNSKLFFHLFLFQ